jgi:hypothetical protein
MVYILLLYSSGLGIHLLTAVLRAVVFTDLSS